MCDLVTLAIVDGLARITLARPDAGNAMHWDLIDALATRCEAIAADPTVRAVLVTAQGRNFCVGGDIRAFAQEADASAFIERLAARLHDGLRALAGIDAPLIVAVQGAAAGAGLSLAAAGDIVIAGESASFSMAYTALGLTSDGGATWTLPRVIGLRRTQEMAFLNRRLSAQEAEHYGLVTPLVADDAVEAEGLAVATAIAAGPLRAYGGIKRLLRDSYGATLSDQLDAEAKAIGTALRTEDAQGADKAFLARERPFSKASDDGGEALPLCEGCPADIRKGHGNGSGGFNGRTGWQGGLSQRSEALADIARVHAAVLLSMMERAGGCTLETVGYAFDTQLAARRAPLGIIEVEIAGYGPASLLWAKDDQPR